MAPTPFICVSRKLPCPQFALTFDRKHQASFAKPFVKTSLTSATQGQEGVARVSAELDFVFGTRQGEKSTGAMSAFKRFLQLRFISQEKSQIKCTGRSSLLPPVTKVWKWPYTTKTLGHILGTKLLSTQG